MLIILGTVLTWGINFTYVPCEQPFKWERLEFDSPHPEARAHPSIVAVDDAVFVYGGHAEFTLSQDLWRFDRSSLKWTQLHSHSSADMDEGGDNSFSLFALMPPLHRYPINELEVVIMILVKPLFVLYRLGIILISSTRRMR